MQYDSQSSRLFWIATLALVLGAAVFAPLALASVPLYLVAALLRLGGHDHSAQLFCWGAALFSGIAAIGLIALYQTWGSLEYRLAGYVILFGPFVAMLTALALVAGYISVR
jgi:hypothetical protein